MKKNKKYSTSFKTTKTKTANFKKTNLALGALGKNIDLNALEKTLKYLKYYGSPNYKDKKGRIKTEKQKQPGGFKRNIPKRIGYKKTKVFEIGGWELHRKKKVRIDKGGVSEFGDFDVRTTEAIKKGWRKFSDKDKGALYLAIAHNVMHGRRMYHHAQIHSRWGTNYLNRLNTSVIENNLTTQEAYHRLQTDILRVTAVNRGELIRQYVKGVGMKIGLLIKGELKHKQSELTKLKFNQSFEAKTLKKRLFRKLHAFALNLKDIIKELVIDSPLWQMIRSWDRKTQNKIRKKYLEKHKNKKIPKNFDI